MTDYNVDELNRRFDKAAPESVLEWALDEFQNDLILACSFGPEDTALLDILTGLSDNPRVFVLDTGRLHEATYEMLNSCRTRYGIDFEIYFPEQQKVQALLQNKGPFSFYDSVENRKECCAIRKVDGLGRALGGVRAWITGLRRAQSDARSAVPRFEIDRAHNNILKINPLVDWTYEDVLGYHERHKIPMHALINKGYPSIGCEPCTRAIQPGEDLRAGRWWWESSQKECGLHVTHIGSNI